MRSKLQKLFVLLGMCMFGAANSFAASFELINTEETLATDLNTVVKSHNTIKNLTGNNLNVNLTITPVELGEGHFFQACTDMCYAPVNKTFTTPNPFELPANAELEYYVSLIPNRDADYDGVPDGKVGTTILNLKYINAADERDFAEYTATFTVGEAGIIEYWKQENVVYPNPSSDRVVVRLNDALDANSNLNLYDSFGNLISKKVLAGGTASFEFDANSLTNGDYRFTISSEGKVVNSGSFVITK